MIIQGIQEEYQVLINGEIINCFNDGVIEASSDAVAGICGINYSNITNCYNLAEVVNHTYSTGGIVGYNLSNTNIVNCINSGDIKTELDTIGGILGFTGYVNIDNCKSKCNLQGRNNVGGIVGRISNNVDNIEISNCMWYANSEVQYGIGSISSNEGAAYVENLQLDSVLDIVNGENNFKLKGEKVVLKWQ